MCQVSAFGAWATRARRIGTAARAIAGIPDISRASREIGNDLTSAMTMAMTRRMFRSDGCALLSLLIKHISCRHASSGMRAMRLAHAHLVKHRPRLLAALLTIRALNLLKRVRRFLMQCLRYIRVLRLNHPSDCCDTVDS